MKLSDENFASMVWNVRGTLKKHETLWKGRQSFSKSAYLFIALIDELANETFVPNELAVVDHEEKDSVAESAINLGVNLAKRASIYALDKQDIQLHDNLRMSRKSLLIRPERLAAAKLREVWAIMKSIGSDLVLYEVNNKDLNSLDQEIALFETAINQTSLHRLSNGNTLRTVTAQLKNIRQVLYRLDSLINIFEETFFEPEYKNARNITERENVK